MNTADYGALLGKELAKTGDYEARLDVLRLFTRAHQSRLRALDAAGSLPLEALFLDLASLAEAVVEGGERVAREELKDKGVAAPFGDRFAVVAMGKFGGREITYHSDLDVVFLYDRPESQEFATKLAARIISALGLLTRNGWAYKIDAELRPSGNSGALVSSLASFRDYHREVGQVWERQALIKARPVTGPGDFRKTLQDAFEAVSYRDDDAGAVAAEIDRLRGRMEREIARERPGRINLKTGRGGIVDIEFAVQYLQLIHGKNRPNLRTPSTLEALARLASEGILDPPLAEALRKAYLFYREVETRLRITLDQPADEIWEGSEMSRRMIADFFGGRPVLEELRRTREEVRGIYDRILKGKAP